VAHQKEHTEMLVLQNVSETRLSTKENARENALLSLELREDQVAHGSKLETSQQENNAAHGKTNVKQDHVLLLEENVELLESPELFNQNLNAHGSKEERLKREDVATGLENVLETNAKSLITTVNSSEEELERNPRAVADGEDSLEDQDKKFVAREERTKTVLEMTARSSSENAKKDLLFQTQSQTNATGETLQRTVNVDNAVNTEEDVSMTNASSQRFVVHSEVKLSAPFQARDVT